MTRVNVEATEDDGDRLLHEGLPYTGEVVEISREGHLLSLHTYFAGIPDGPYHEWCGPGRPFREGTLRAGLLQGITREWHPNGQLAVEAEFDEHGRQLRRDGWDGEGVPTGGARPGTSGPRGGTSAGTTGRNT